MSAGRHPKSDVASALTAAKTAGLIVTEDHKGHRWGRVRCAGCGLTRAVWGTPRNPGDHAKQIVRFTAEHMGHGRGPPMTTWTFTLRLDRPPTGDELDALYEAGLDDAAVDSDGTVSLDRQAPTLLAAITSAVEDVRKVPGLRVVGVDTGGDGVTLGDIAQRLGGRRTVESLRLLAADRRGPGGFPPPVVDTGKVRVYSWAQVSAWLRDALGEDVPAVNGDLVLADAALRLAAQAAASHHEVEVARLLSA